MKLEGINMNTNSQLIGHYHIKMEAKTNLALNMLNPNKSRFVNSVNLNQLAFKPADQDPHCFRLLVNPC